MFELIKTRQEIVLENKELLNKLIQLSISELAILEKINSKKTEFIKKEIEFKVFSDSLDEIDKIELKKFNERLIKERNLIEEAMDRKYFDYFSEIK